MAPFLFVTVPVMCFNLSNMRGILSKIRQWLSKICFTLHLNAIGNYLMPKAKDNDSGATHPPESSPKFNKTIWTCWFQGMDNESCPQLNKLCIQAWKDLHPDWTVVVLTKHTIKDYVPEYEEIMSNLRLLANLKINRGTGNKFRSWAACSDLLRLLLLSKYGGVWVDASSLPARRLDDYIYSLLKPKGFFGFRFVKRHRSREVASWFLAVDRPKHPLIEIWKHKFIGTFITKRGWPVYFQVHKDLTSLYDNNRQIKDIIDGMPQIKFHPGSPAIEMNMNSCNFFILKRPLWVHRNPDFVDFYKNDFFQTVINSVGLATDDGYNWTTRGAAGPSESIKGKEVIKPRDYSVEGAKAELFITEDQCDANISGDYDGDV